MTNFTFNPLTELMLKRRDGEVLAIQAAAPVRGRPLRVLSISRDDDPEIFEVLHQIARGKPIHTEIDEDLWARLVEFGLLIPEDEIPIVPRLHCDPIRMPPELVPRRRRDAIMPDEARLRVNPSLRYQDEMRPPDEGRVPKMTFGVGLERAIVNPFAENCAWAWVEHPDIGLPSALSIDAPLRETFRRLRPGAAPPADLDEDMKRALLRADVLVDPSDIDKRRASWALMRAEAAASVRRARYGVLRGLIHPLYVASIRRYFRGLVAEGHVRLDGHQVLLRFGAHNEPLARILQRGLTDLVSEISGEPVKPSYAYFAAYMPGAVLKPHKDRDQCAISISLQLDYQPEPEDVSPWPLYLGLDDKAPLENPTAIELGLGDGLFYRGTELVHWRDALPEGHASTSVFLHYVPADFRGSLD